jgi:thioredoxin reductase (NADPH)
LHAEGEAGNFVVQTTRARYRTRFIIVATGFFDQPNMMGVPGEDLPKVTHYYKEPFGYSGQDVAIIGAKNSAAKAALDCYRHGARVTLLVRGPALSPSIKYWIKPDLENRIAEGSIAAFFNVTVRSIEPDVIVIETPDGVRSLKNDWVLAMTGYRPNYDFLEALGIAFADDEARTPVHDPETYETNRAGVYLAGTVCGGLNTSRWFIENGRFHASQIVKDIGQKYGVRTVTP